MLAIACSDANADEIVKIAIGQAFDIQIDWRTVEYLVREVNCVDLFFADGERPQRMMKFLLFASEFSTTAARTERVGKLRDREYPLAVQLFAVA